VFVQDVGGTATLSLIVVRPLSEKTRREEGCRALMCQGEEELPRPFPHSHRLPPARVLPQTSW
jgi:hypothetical protein